MSKKMLKHLEEMEDFQYSNLQGISDTESEEYKNQQKELVELVKMVQAQEQIEIQKEESKKKETFEWVKIGATIAGTVIVPIVTMVYHENRTREFMKYMQIFDYENPGSSTAKQMVTRRIEKFWK